MTLLVLAIIFLVIGVSLIVFATPIAKFEYNHNHQLWKDGIGESTIPWINWNWYWQQGVRLVVWILRIIGTGCLIAAVIFLLLHFHVL